VTVAVGVAISIFLERDFQLAASRPISRLRSSCLRRENRRASAKPAARSGRVRDDSRLEAVNLLDDFDGNHDVIVREIKERVWVVEKDVGVEYVIFHFYVL